MTDEDLVYMYEERLAICLEDGRQSRSVAHENAKIDVMAELCKCGSVTKAAEKFKKLTEKYDLDKR